jgi:cell wall-associated NlpC family hydrolase
MYSTKKTIILAICGLALTTILSCNISKKTTTYSRPSKPTESSKNTTKVTTKTKSTKSKKPNETLIGFAKKFVGTPYLSGGTDETGFDCSGFVRFVYDNFDVELPHSSNAMSQLGYSIEKENIKVGDLVFFITTGGSTINHVGLVSSIQNNDVSFIHSSTSNGVREDKLSTTYYTKTYVTAKRIK